MFDISKITDDDIKEKLSYELSISEPFSDKWRIVGTALNSLQHETFTGTKTYPRPDHPDPRKKRPLEFLLIGILVSLRTTLENEQLAMDRLLEKCQTADDVARLSDEELAEIIKPSGMAKQKSIRIHECLEKISLLDGGLDSLQTYSKEEARRYLLSLPGIGPKAADCLMTIGLGFSSMVVDINVFRMSCYLFDIDINDRFNFSNPQSVKYIKSRLDNAIGEDAFLCQILHTMLLLSGRKLGKNHNYNKCYGKKYCLSCQKSDDSHYHQLTLDL